MLSPPESLTSAALVRVLSDGWGLAVTSIGYRPVGFGSHHWEVTDAGQARWFVTADELDRRQFTTEPAGAPFGRLRAALATALDLRAGGASFVIAPIPTRAGEPLVLTDAGMGVALYPFVDGQSFSWGDFSSPAHRRGVLDLLVALHTAPAAARRHALADDFAVPHRDELELALGHDAAGWQGGPYASRAAALLAGSEAKIRRLLASYDHLVLQAARWPGRTVLSHGEPHPGNTMLTSAGWVLIDWDTVLLAPPERDLWSLDPGDGSILGAYSGATGTELLPPLLELYRIRWDVTDIAVDVNRFRGPHTGSLDDDKSWDLLRSLIGQLPG